MTLPVLLEKITTLYNLYENDENILNKLTNHINTELPIILKSTPVH